MLFNARPVLANPVGKTFQGRQQAGAQRSELVLHPRRDFRVLVAPQQAVAFQMAQCERQHALGDALYAEPQFRKAQAMTGAHGVFSVQPSSPQVMYGITDEDEVRYGRVVADVAVSSGVRHLVYASTAAVAGGPTGMGHMDAKAAIEAYIGLLPLRTTIVRPATFMEMLVMPGFGLDQGQFNFFMHPEQSMQVLAVADIGRIVEVVFAAPDRLAGPIELASDSVTGHDLQAVFSAAAGRPIRYARFSDEVLAGNNFLARLTELNDRGRLAGRADLQALRAVHPGLLSFSSWLAGPGREAFRRALEAGGDWGYRQG